MPLTRPMIVAHRGLHSATRPENSVAAFAAAWAAGVAWAECDVWMIPGGPIVLHDETLDRTTDGTGSVLDQWIYDVANRHLRDATGVVTPHRVPRLSDVAAAMRADDGLLVEVKGGDHGDFVPDLMRAVRGRTVMLQSFDRRHLYLASRFDRRIPLAWLVETAADLAAATTTRYPAVHARHDLLDVRSVRRLRRAGKRVGAWTVNEATDVRRMAALGVERIITDDPIRARQVIDGR